MLYCAGSTKQSKMKPKQSQDDLVRFYKELLRGMSIDVTYHHTKGHMDNILRKDQLSLEESLNVKADELADEALKMAVRENTEMNTDLPYEQIKVINNITGQKAAGLIADNLSKWCGRRMCRNLFVNRKHIGSKIPWAQYENIYWAGMEHVMKKFPQLFRNWVTKQVLGMSGCTSAKAHWVKNLEDKCQSCGKTGDTSTHVTRCKDPGRVVTFKKIGASPL